MDGTRSKILGAFAVGLLFGGAALYLRDTSKPAASPTATPSSPAPPPSLSMQFQEPRPELLRQLREGGLMIYFRHAQRQKWDSVIGFDVYEIAAAADGSKSSFYNAVCLTPQGIEEAKMLGEIFKLARIPVGHVVASPSCRARQTAKLAWGRIDAISNGLAHTPVVNAGNDAAFTAELKRILTTSPIQPGTNTIISAHGNTLDNNLEIFKSGAELVSRTLLLETGCYVIRRDADGSLHILQRFNEVGHLASSMIDLDPTAPSPFLNQEVRIPTVPVPSTF